MFRHGPVAARPQPGGRDHVVVPGLVVRDEEQVKDQWGAQVMKYYIFCVAATIYHKQKEYTREKIISFTNAKHGNG